MAKCETRGGVYQRLAKCGRSGERAGQVLRLLQPPALAPIAIVPDPGSGVLAMARVSQDVLRLPLWAGRGGSRVAEVALEQVEVTNVGDIVKVEVRREVS